MPTSGFTRKISITELTCYTLQRLTSPYVVQYTVRGVGSIAEDELRNAVDIAARSSPGARLVRDGDMWVDRGEAPLVRVIRNHRIDYARLDEDDVLNSPIGGYPSERTVEVVVLPDDGPRLVFRAFHGVMDGGGLLMWITDVFRALRGEEPLGAPDGTTDEDVVAQLGAPGSPTKLGFSYPSPVGTGRRRPGSPRFQSLYREVEAAPSAAVARIAATLAARSKGTSRFMVPVSLRRHIPTLRSNANLALPLFLDVEPGQSWAEIQQELIRAMRERRELNELNLSITKIPPAVFLAMQRGMYAAGATFGRDAVSALISDGGRFDLDDLRAPGFRTDSVHVMPGHTMTIPLNISVTQAGDVTSLSVSSRTGRSIPERLDELIDDVVDGLVSR